MFKVIFHKSAAKKFSKLSQSDKERIGKIIDSLSINPYAGKKLRGELEGSRRMRVGAFRIIYDILESEGIVLVHAIGSRGDIYK